MTSDPPKRLGPVADLVFTGAVFPWRDPVNGPVLVRIRGDTFDCIPVFTDAARLRPFLERGRIALDGIKQIVDGRAFLEGLRQSARRDFRVAVNPFWTEEGCVRYFLVDPWGDEPT